MPDEPQTGWVRIFKFGVRRGEPYTPSDGDDIVANFKRFHERMPNPAVIGHEETSKWLEDTGLPAAGWVADLRRNGPYLEARFDRMPPIVARLVERGAYRTVSAEIYHEAPEGIPARGKMLRRVAFLGGEIPHVKSLGDIDALWERPVGSESGKPEGKAGKANPALAFSERIHLPGGTWAVFSEVIVMAEGNGVEAIANAAIATAFPGLPPEFIESLTPDQMSMLAPAIGGEPVMEEEPLEEPGLDMMQEFPPEAPDRDSLIAALVELGQDPEALAVMSDEELIALWNEQMGGGGLPEEPVEMSEEPIMPTSDTANRQPKKVTVTQAFSEALRREVKKIVAVETVKLRKESAVRRGEERRKAIRSFCERMVEAGKLSSAQAEFNQKGEAVGPVAQRLLRADGIRKFSDGKTDLQLQMEEIERGPARRFGEKIPDPISGQNGGLTPERRRELLGYTGVGRTILRDEAKKN